MIMKEEVGETKDNGLRNQAPRLRGYNFTEEAAWVAQRTGRLLSARIDLGYGCNFRCIYCNQDSTEVPRMPLRLTEIMGAIRQCKDLGAKSIVIIGGGEPTIQPEFRELISYIFNLGLVPVVFTNGTAIDQHLARFLFEHDASILLKLDSTNADTQDTLAGFRGASEIASTALKSLSQSGYMQNSIGELRLGISFVSTLANVSEIPSLWKFCREAGIYPNHELLILRGAARSNRHFLELANERVAKLKEELRLIDRSYGYDWLPYKPLTGCGCLQILYSVYIASDGFVKPCADIDISRFNIRELSVAEILQSDFFRLVRNMKDHLRGKCKTCQHHYECLGCRGAAFAFATLNGEGPESAVTSEDPFCWK